MRFIVRLVVIGNSEYINQAIQRTLKYNCCYFDFEPPRIATLSKNLDLMVCNVLLSHALEVQDQLTRIRMEKIPEVHGQKLFPRVAGHNLSRMIYVVQTVALTDEDRPCYGLR